MTDPGVISGYDAHIYFEAGDGPARDAAIELRSQLVERFAAREGTTREDAGGPHPMPELQAEFACDRFSDVVPWLMLNRGDLRVLVHPITGDAAADHGEHALWLGEPVALNFEAL